MFLKLTLLSCLSRDDVARLQLRLFERFAREGLSTGQTAQTDTPYI